MACVKWLSRLGSASRSAGGFRKLPLDTPIEEGLSSIFAMDVGPELHRVVAAVSEWPAQPRPLIAGMSDTDLASICNGGRVSGRPPLG
jgi:hypothetical protein